MKCSTLSLLLLAISICLCASSCTATKKTITTDVDTTRINIIQAAADSIRSRSSSYSASQSHIDSLITHITSGSITSIQITQVDYDPSIPDADGSPSKIRETSAIITHRDSTITDDMLVRQWELEEHFKDSIIDELRKQICVYDSLAEKMTMQQISSRSTSATASLRFWLPFIIIIVGLYLLHQFGLLSLIIRFIGSMIRALYDLARKLISLIRHRSFGSPGSGLP